MCLLHKSINYRRTGNVYCDFIFAKDKNAKIQSRVVFSIYVFDLHMLYCAKIKSCKNF